MTSTRNGVVRGKGNPSAHGVVRLRLRSEGGEISFDELPIAVGFGSPVGVPSRRLHAVPGLPVEFIDVPRSGRGGRVIALPLGDLGDLVDPSSAPVLDHSYENAATAVVPTMESVPLRLTRRGQVVLLAVAAAIGSAVVVSAWFGASSPTPPARAALPAQVVVHDGDTLWSIVGRIAPGRDPRAVIDQLLRINHLTTPALVPGQVLRTR